MRVALAGLVLSLLLVAASTAASLRALRREALHARDASCGTGAHGDAASEACARAFRAKSAAVTDADIAMRYAGSAELLDPATALPAWHRGERAQAARVHAALTVCARGHDAPPVSDPVLQKALTWHALTCAETQLSPEARKLLAAPPWMHPSGRSYAALAHEQFRDVRGGAVHVTELPASDPLGALSVDAWVSLRQGASWVATDAAWIAAERDARGLVALHFHDRAAWDAFLAERGAASVWARHAHALATWRWLAWGLSALAAMAVAVTYVRDKRRMEGDRLHVLRTLTHELRTPTTSLRLGLDELTRDWDALPAASQEATLRVIDDAERLQRVLHRSARYLALFEVRGGGGAELATFAQHTSARALLEELATEWPAGVELVPGARDGAVTTDAAWLSVLVRNLVENATRHGAPPARVTWVLEDAWLVVRVADGGDSRGLSLARAVRPHWRGAASGGLGLGLAIAERAARLLGGRLSHRASPTVFEARVRCSAREAAA